MTTNARYFQNAADFLVEIGYDWWGWRWLSYNYGWFGRRCRNRNWFRLFFRRGWLGGWRFRFFRDLGCRRLGFQLRYNHRFGAVFGVKLAREEEKSDKSVLHKSFSQGPYLVPASADSLAASRSFSNRLSGFFAFGFGAFATATVFGLGATGFFGAGGGLSMRSCPPWPTL